MYDRFSYSFEPCCEDSDLLTSVIAEFIDAKTAERLSPNTLADYQNTYKCFVKFIGGEKKVGEIEAKDIRAFLASLVHLSKKTVKNYWIGLSSLWSWAVMEGYAAEHVVRRVRPPKPEVKVVDPMSKEDVCRLLDANSLYQLRNRAIIYVLVDSGIRATELCELKLDDISSVTLKVHGKGDREREVPLSDRSWRAMMDYLHSRDHADDHALFVSARGRALTRSGLYQVLRKLGESVGVERAYPHRMRHTFAINYLRNGGDVYTLMKILGHSSMEMTKKYLAIANADIEVAHRRASPVKGWGL